MFSLFKQGLSEYKVVLGDSNLKLELPYGVQEHSIDKAVVHENYDINDELHKNDIGKRAFYSLKSLSISLYHYIYPHFL